MITLNLEDLDNISLELSRVKNLVFLFENNSIYENLGNVCIDYSVYEILKEKILKLELLLQNI